MLAFYRKLLRLYPPGYFREYGEEMSWVFARTSDDVAAKKLVAQCVFYTHEFSGVIAGAVRQRLLGFDGSSRRLEMEFRFPRSTVVLMWVILAGLLMAIAEAKIVAMRYGAIETRTVWNMLPWFIVVAAVLVCGAGAAVWGVLYALRRTGMHRMEKLDT
jgi:hypothetical protein